MIGVKVPSAAFAWLASAVLQIACAAQERAPHGAAAFDRQQHELAALSTVKPGTIPPGVDVEFWRLFAKTVDTPAQVALGQRLFFDPRLSSDGTVSCATCHDVTRAFSDQRPVSEGIGGKLGRRNAPTVMNAALIEPLFWDGRSPTLSHQAGQPIMNPIEMGMPDKPSVVATVAKLDDYEQAFQTAYGRPVDYDAIEQALAAFQRTLIFLDAPFDRFKAGDQTAISESAKRGLVLFEGKASCVACHPLNATNPLGTDYRFHNIGVSARNQNFEQLAVDALNALDADSSEVELDRLALATDLGELGRFMVTRNRADIGAFRTPQLRNIGITQPYMHDGSMQTLWDTVDHYNKGGEVNAFLDGGIEALALTEPEIDDLVAFMFTLTDRRFAAQNEDQFRKQQALSRTQRPFRDDERAMRRKLAFEDRVGNVGEKR